MCKSATWLPIGSDYRFNSKQCKFKWKRLYMKSVDNIGSKGSGEAPRYFKYFDEIDEIFSDMWYQSHWDLHREVVCHFANFIIWKLTKLLHHNLNITIFSGSSLDITNFGPYRYIKCSEFNSKVHSAYDLKEKPLLSMVKEISSQLRRMTRKKDHFKTRSHLAERSTEKLFLEEKIASLSLFASTFIQCQLREAGRFGRQHRFTVEEKIMASKLERKLISLFIRKL